MKQQTKTWLNHTTLVTATAICVLCSFPQEGISLEAKGHSIEQLAINFVDQAQSSDEDAFQKQCAELVEFFNNSEDCLDDAYQYLTALVGQIHESYGYTLTVSELIQQIRGNLHYVEFSDFNEAELIEGLDTLQTYASEMAIKKSNGKENQFLALKSPKEKKIVKNKGPMEAIFVTLIIVGGVVAFGFASPSSIPKIIEGAALIGEAIFKSKTKK